MIFTPQTSLLLGLTYSQLFDIIAARDVLEVLTMKKLALFLVLLFVCILIASCMKVNNIPDTNAVLVFKYSDKNIEVALSSDESKTIKGIFDQKRLYADNPSCGFSEDISIRFGDLVFCVACDGCATVRLNDRFFSVSDSDRAVIDQLFEKYGGFFPCV